MVKTHTLLGLAIVLALPAGTLLGADADKNSAYNEQHEQELIEAEQQAEERIAQSQEPPAGWENHLHTGSVMDEELYRFSKPVAAHVSAMLPPLPAGLKQIRIKDKIIRLDKNDLKIHEIIVMDY